MSASVSPSASVSSSVTPTLYLSPSVLPSVTPNTSVSPSRAASPSVSASRSPSTSGSPTLTPSGSPFPAPLTFSVSAPAKVALNALSERIVFSATRLGAPSTALLPTVVSLSSTAAAGSYAFYADSNGTQAVTSATLAPGDDSFVVWYKQTATAATVTLSATRVSGDPTTTATVSVVVASAGTASARVLVTCKTTGGSTLKSTMTGSGCTVPTTQFATLIVGWDTDPRAEVMLDPAGWMLLAYRSVDTSPSGGKLGIKIYTRMGTGVTITPTTATANAT